MSFVNLDQFGFKQNQSNISVKIKTQNKANLRIETFIKIVILVILCVKK